MTTTHPQPYGAAELKRVAQAHMAKAVSLGSGLWICLFALAMTASMLVPKPIVVPHGVIIERPFQVEPPPLVPPMNYEVPTTRPPQVAPKEGPVQVVDEVLPPPDPAKAGPWFDPTLPVGPVGDAKPAPPGESFATPGDGVQPETPWIYYDEPPAVVSKPRPEYPDLARQAGVEGTVRLLVFVGVDGRVREAKVVASVPLLDAAALEAIRRWTFTPALANGHPVAVWVAVPVVFRLH